MVTGKAVAITFASLIVLGVAIAVAYKVREAGLPETSMTFTREAAPEGSQASLLPYKPVHDRFFLEDHLDTALERGSSVESVRLRVETMQEALADLTGHVGPEWWVVWKGHSFRVAIA